MVKSLCVMSVVALAGVAQAGFIDGTVRIDQTAYSAGSGGEFKATPITGWVGLTGLVSDLSSDSFQTFCMETSENFHPGSVYSAVINTGAVMGSVGGFDPLDQRTAFLYTLFRNGVLPGYDYTPAGRQASAGDLQNAIWYIEGEGGANNGFVAMADAAVLSGSWSGIGAVRVLNIYDDAGALRQDQLTIIPAPGAALVGLAGLAAIRRRR